MTVLYRPAVSVVVPCFDEGEVLPLFLSRVGGVLDSFGGTNELALVDDGSSDRTWEIIEKALGGAEESAADTKPPSQLAIPPATMSPYAVHL